MTVPDSPLRAAARGGNLDATTWSPGDYADGGEQAVLEHIRASSDLSSLSDELARKASTWAERYHLSPDRANILRAIQLHRTDKVLEVGAGCGAITRYLGEVCALVDAVEPEPARAQVAAERTRDIESVRVFAAEIDQVPKVPFYDLAFVIGVLEYVGAGSDDVNLYVDFLRKVAARLTPQGTLVCAIENQFGVKYLSGAPEDHTGLPFDGVTGYQEGKVARTFSRSALADLLRRAGLEVTFLHAFPDYKMARVVFADEVFDEPYRWVANEIPQFPSPERTPGPPRIVDEERVWEALVRSGEASPLCELVRRPRFALGVRATVAAGSSRRVFRAGPCTDLPDGECPRWRCQPHAGPSSSRPFREQARDARTHVHEHRTRGRRAPRSCARFDGLARHRPDLE